MLQRLHQQPLLNGWVEHGASTAASPTALLLLCSMPSAVRCCDCSCRISCRQVEGLRDGGRLRLTGDVRPRQAGWNFDFESGSLTLSAG